MVRLTVSQTWNGQPLEPEEMTELSFFLEKQSLVIEIDAPYHRDRPPGAPPGSLDKLWEYEVVELFLLGWDEHYLEIELGPHGHYLVLQLHGSRRIIARDLPIDYRTGKSANRWRGVARVPRIYLPAKVRRGNAYAIHGEGENRRYLAAFAAGGVEPDFHRLETFGSISL